MQVCNAGKHMKKIRQWEYFSVFEVINQSAFAVLYAEDVL